MSLSKYDKLLCVIFLCEGDLHIKYVIGCVLLNSTQQQVGLLSAWLSGKLPALFLTICKYRVNKMRLRFISTSTITR